MKITTDEILDALRQAMEPAQSPGGDEYYTVWELRELTGWGENKVREALQRMTHHGQLNYSKVQRLSINKEWRWVPGYRLTIHHDTRPEASSD